LNSLASTAPERVADLLDLRQKFLSWFARRDAFICKPYTIKRWKTVKAPLFDALILRAISDTRRGLFRGCFSSHKTMFAVLDIDIQSKYRNETELKKLQAILAAVGLYGILYRSSESGGWHLYLPLDEWEDSEEIETTLKTWLKCLGYEIAGGQLEVFPSGNGLRLPLQKGFAWLNPDGSIKVRREEITEDEALASFVQDFENNARNWQQAKRHIESQIYSAGKTAGAGAQEHEKVVSIADFDDLYRRGRIQEKWDKGRAYWLHGLTEKNQRHDAIQAVGHYLWYGDPLENVPAYPGRRNNETRARLIEAWLRKKHNGKCNHINRGHWKEIEADIRRAVLWRKQKGYQVYKPYPVTDRVIDRLIEVYNEKGQLFEIDRMAEANNNRLEDARSRIKKAIKELIAEGTVITKSEIARRAGANRATVSKHSDLLAIWPGVNSSGVWGVSSDSMVPEIGFEEQENSEDPLCFKADSGDLELEDRKTLVVAPLAICLANSQPESTQHQDQALRVAAQVLTPGPLLSGIQAVRQMGAGGILLFHRSHAGRAPPGQ